MTELFLFILLPLAKNFMHRLYLRIILGGVYCGSDRRYKQRQIFRFIIPAPLNRGDSFKFSTDIIPLANQGIDRYE